MLLLVTDYNDVTVLQATMDIQGTDFVLYVVFSSQINPVCNKHSKKAKMNTRLTHTSQSLNEYISMYKNTISVTNNTLANSFSITVNTSVIYKNSYRWEGGEVDDGGTSPL